MRTFFTAFLLVPWLSILSEPLPGASAAPQNPATGAGGLDRRVREFLGDRGGTWVDLNIPASDGQMLHDLIVKHKYKSALEIGTSTGHSGIWIAWALSKTGGRLITIDIDPRRRRTAMENFRAAGLEAFVDSRLGDAHQLVPALAGPFDFVFCDADKDWYKNYLEAALPKLSAGGCFAAHNVSEAHPTVYGGEFLKFARGRADVETSVVETARSGISLSFKKPSR